MMQCHEVRESSDLTSAEKPPVADDEMKVLIFLFWWRHNKPFAMLQIWN